MILENKLDTSETKLGGSLLINLALLLLSFMKFETIVNVYLTFHKSQQKNTWLLRHLKPKSVVYNIFFHNLIFSDKIHFQ